MLYNFVIKNSNCKNENEEKKQQKNPSDINFLFATFLSFCFQTQSVQTKICIYQYLHFCWYFSNQSKGIKHFDHFRYSNHSRRRRFIRITINSANKSCWKQIFECENGQQFFIKGIAYQKSRQEGEIYDATKEPHYVDPLANPFTCLRDLEYLKELGVNVIRVYQINPNANHDVCMNAFAEAGIYVLADLSEPYMSIRRDYPHWDTELFNRYKEVIDAMNKYNNMLGFLLVMKLLMLNLILIQVLLLEQL